MTQQISSKSYNDVVGALENDPNSSLATILRDPGAAIQVSAIFLGESLL